ncbi:hypothetical protein VaNZ11_003766 [Volvox africanus]|uniref:Uncharacterized protein n=1 Tax=Volvox africanus TaxID=51714 RepID=A0ABQ5RUV7_9CHLO|nr:hypothetical protein VaNZ11_003766 [Volvox africanus]
MTAIIADQLVILVIGAPDKEVIGAPDKESLGAPDRDAIGAPDKEAIGAPDKEAIGALDKESIGAPDKEAIGALDKEVIGVPDKEAIGVPDKEAIGAPDKEAIGAPDREAIGAPVIIDRGAWRLEPIIGVDVRCPHNEDVRARQAVWQGKTGGDVRVAAWCDLAAKCKSVVTTRKMALHRRSTIRLWFLLRTP